jgi:4-amino-4-deoxy-L-arabinose transferase-like glycosyltransferase
MLAIQLLNAVLGAATAPIIFLCAEHVFNNRKVARVAGLAVAFYPSLVLWSSQGLKDGPTVFFLALSILATLRLGHKLTLRYLAILLVSLVGVLAFRFYIFYMMVAAIIGAYVIGMKAFTAQSMARQFIVVLVIGLSFTYFGVTRYATAQFEQFGNLEQLNRSRQDLATSAKSGFGRDVDVSTTSGALSTIPTGLVYLLFAPFPWQLGSLRQSLTLPEMVVWWAAFPLLILGAWFSIRYRLRQMAPILIFTSMLTLAYSVFQGNVGTAYRQRGQILVFYFIFVAVGSVLVKEKRDQRRRRAAEELRLATLGLKPGLATPEQRVS